MPSAASPPPPAPPRPSTPPLTTDFFWERAREAAYPLTFSTDCVRSLDHRFNAAISQMESEGVSADYEKIDEASKNTTVFVEKMRERALQLGATVIELDHLEWTLAVLCPFWPICKRKR
jgi:hypothetical protein